MAMQKLIKPLAAALLISAAAVFTTPPAVAAGGAALPTQKWSFAGMFGTFDRGEAQRGFQIYSEVCAGCHSLNQIAYRHLAGIGFSENQIKAIAAEVEVEDGPDEEGELCMRPGRPGDRVVKPFANEQAARASNNGALPPDLSLMIKARKGGADYLYALLTGYEEEAPEGMTLMEGMNYNHYFAGNQIAMAPPLAEDAVEYADGTKASLEQEARDISTFLAWTAEPELEARKRMGVIVMLVLLVLTGMLYAVKKAIWSDQH
jgi:ubiquinol-cytochrome c reductase cytochrome c1 subunit